MDDNGPTFAIELTQKEIAFLRTALDDSERTLGEPSYDPQVQEWARRHATDSRETLAGIRAALAKGSLNGPG